MTIRAAVRADLTPLEGAESFFKEAPKATERVLEGVKKKHGKRLIRPLHKMSPGRSKHGGRWSTNPAANRRARGWWFANRSKIKPRSGKLRKQYIMAVRKTPRRVSLTIENPSSKAHFVFSNAKKARADGGRPNPGHIATKWPQKSREVSLKQLEIAKGKVEDAYQASAVASIAKGRFVIVVP